MASRITSRISRLSHHVPRLFSTSYCRLYSTRTSKPLRILYCGSDEFSIASLRAVHDYQLSNPEAVASIDVLIRPAKPSGRGRKTLKESPIKAVAQNLGLRLYERDTFTGWDVCSPFPPPFLRSRGTQTHHPSSQRSTTSPSTSSLPSPSASSSPHASSTAASTVA
jgi:hypothetical protein